MGKHQNLFWIGFFVGTRLQPFLNVCVYILKLDNSKNYDSQKYSIKNVNIYINAIVQA